MTKQKQPRESPLGKADLSRGRKWYDRAVEWTERNQSENGQRRRFRTEAEKLLKTAVKEPTAKAESK